MRRHVQLELVCCRCYLHDLDAEQFHLDFVHCHRPRIHHRLTKYKNNVLEYSGLVTHVGISRAVARQMVGWLAVHTPNRHTKGVDTALW